MKRPSWPGLLRDAFSSTALDDDVIKDARRRHRRGMVHAVSATTGRLAGIVRDDEENLQAHWHVSPLPEEDWALVEDRIHASPLVMATLLGRQRVHVTSELSDIVTALIAHPAGLEASCGCDDCLAPCPHALAVALAFADLTPDDLWPLFQLRGRTHDWLVASEAAARAGLLLARYET